MSFLALSEKALFLLPAALSNLTWSRTFIYRRLLRNQNSSGLQCEVAKIGSRQRSALNSHPLPERTAARQTHLCRMQPAALWPLPRYDLQQRLTTFSSEYCQVLNTNCYSFTYLRGIEGWVGLRTTSVNNLLKVITRQRSWWDSKSRRHKYDKNSMGDYVTKWHF